MRWTALSGECIIELFYLALTVFHWLALAGKISEKGQINLYIGSVEKCNELLKALVNSQLSMGLCPDCKLTLPLIKRLRSSLWLGLALLPCYYLRHCAMQMLQMEACEPPGHELSLCGAIPCASAPHFAECSAAECVSRVRAL